MKANKVIPENFIAVPAGGRGASASACADLTNQLQCGWAIVRYCRIPVDGGGGHHALYC